MYDFYPKSVLYYYSLYAGLFKYKIDLLYTVKVTFYSKISSFTPIPLSQNAFQSPQFKNLNFSPLIHWFQAKNGKQAKKSQLNVSKVAPSLSVEVPHLQAKPKSKTVQETLKVEPKSEVTCSTTFEKDVHSQQSDISEFGTSNHWLPEQSTMPSQPSSSLKKGLLLLSFHFSSYLTTSMAVTMF